MDLLVQLLLFKQTSKELPLLRDLPTLVNLNRKLILEQPPPLITGLPSLMLKLALI